MPQWIFSRRPEDCHATEIDFATYLNCQLGSDWLVRWGYFYQDSSGISREGDFLILGPTGGVCVCEVKSSLFISSDTGGWSESSNPFEQLLAQHHSVVKQFKEHVRSECIPFVEKAIVCPKIEVDRSLTEYRTIPSQYILDLPDCEDFYSGWDRLFKGKKIPVTPDQRGAFMDLYGNHMKCESIKHFLSHTDELILRHTLANSKWLEALSDNQQILVEGGVGCGKTWMAIKAAKNFASTSESEPEKKVLFVVYNIALSRFLKPMLKLGAKKRGQIDLFTFEELCEAICRTAGFDPTELKASAENVAHYFDKTLPEAVALAISSSPEVASQWLESYVALVVDEAQDHNTTLPSIQEECPMGYWSLYAKLLKGGFSGQMFICGDTHQRPPFRGDGSFEMQKLRQALSQGAYVNLRETKRYTRQMATFLRSLRGQGSEKLANSVYIDEHLVDGPEVEQYEIRAHETVKTLEGILDLWQKHGLILAKDVVILYHRSTVDKTVLNGVQKLAKHPMRPYLESLDSSTSPGLSHSSIHKAKGIDSRAVILVGMPAYSRLETDYDRFTYFMGASRARQLLACVHVND